MATSLDDLTRVLGERANRVKFERWRYYTPAPKHLEFFEAGTTHMERGLLAGNGNGKTEAAAYEVSRHLTGVYPDWWKGYRFTKPLRAWAAGPSVTDVRDAAQTKLCGTPGVESDFGSGMIPRDAFVGEPARSRGVPHALDSIQVRHATGGVSRLVFKTYQQDRQDWQGSDQDLFWADEECPLTLYSEGMARLRGRGIALTTMTPLKGMTPLVCRFLEEDDETTRICCRMSLRDCPWYTEEQRNNMVANFPAHEREARINGFPLLGEGAVFSTPVDDLIMPSLPLDKVPLAWAKIWGLDFGIAHPFAAVLLAWDRDEDVVVVLRTVRMRDSIPLQHADAIRRIASGVPVAWPHDGHQRQQDGKDLTELAQLYKRHGLAILAEHATHPTGGFATEPGIMAMEDRMRAGTFRVDALCRDWLEEYRQYHRKNGLIVKDRDDLLSATRVGMMMLRRARPVALGFSRRPNQRRASQAAPLDPWTGRPVVPTYTP